MYCLIADRDSTRIFLTSVWRAQFSSPTSSDQPVRQDEDVVPVASDLSAAGGLVSSRHLEMGTESPTGQASVHHLENIRSIVHLLAEDAASETPVPSLIRGTSS